MSADDKKLTQADENSFAFDYFNLTVANPWWDSAMKQEKAGDKSLIEAIKGKAMRKVCDKYEISRGYGIRIVHQFLAELDPPEGVDPDDPERNV